MADDRDDKRAVILAAEGLTRKIDVDNRTSAIIDNFTFAFRRGEIYTVVGPSGSGKTSLLRLFNRLDEKTTGQVVFNGQPIESYPVTELRKKIALVFQIPHLFAGSVAGNLAYCRAGETPPDPDFTLRYLQLVGLEPELADRDPEKLSVGQKQRVAFARSLVQNPEILLLDEPTSSLDPGAARTIEDLIIDLNKELHLTIIMVTHNFKQALRLGGTSLVLIEGRLVESGLSGALFEKPATDLTRRFVNGDLR
jgi:putative ABC transport system ATP-binding protein